MKIRWQFALGALGAVVVVYSMVVLGFVATTPDLGIRCLMDDPPWENGIADGVVIRMLPAGGEISRERAASQGW